MIYFGLISALTIYRVVHSPHCIVAVVLCFAAWEQWGQLTSEFLLLNSFVMNLVIAGLAILAFALSRRERRNHKSRRATVLSLAIGLVSYALVSILWSADADTASDRWTQNAPAILVGIFIAVTVVNRLEDFADIQRFTIVLGTILCALFLVFGEWDTRSVGIAGSSESTLKLPLGLSQAAGYTFISCALLFQSRGPYWPIMRLVGLFTSFSLVLATQSRGQLLFMLAVTVLFFSASRFAGRYLIAGLSIGLVLLGAGGLIGPAVLIEYGGRFEASAMQQDLDGRVSMATFMLQEWLQSPVSVVFGLGNSSSFAPGLLGVYPHNVPIEILTEEGLIGFSLFAAILAITARRYLMVMRWTSVQSAIRQPVSFLAGLFTYTLLLSMKQGSLLNIADMLMIAILVERLVHMIRQRNTTRRA